MTNARRKELRKLRRKTLLHASLTTPEEVIGLRHSLTTEAMRRVRDIANACPFPLRIDFNDWSTMHGLAIIWNAGRIQGIREERRLRK